MYIILSYTVLLKSTIYGLPLVQDCSEYLYRYLLVSDLILYIVFGYSGNVVLMYSVPIVSNNIAQLSEDMLASLRSIHHRGPIGAKDEVDMLISDIISIGGFSSHTFSVGRWMTYAVFLCLFIPYWC